MQMFAVYPGMPFSMSDGRVKQVVKDATGIDVRLTLGGEGEWVILEGDVPTWTVGEPLVRQVMEAIRQVGLTEKEGVVRTIDSDARDAPWDERKYILVLKAELGLTEEMAAEKSRDEERVRRFIAELERRVMEKHKVRRLWWY